jgi:hypothetical protein
LKLSPRGVLRFVSALEPSDILKLYLTIALFLAFGLAWMRGEQSHGEALKLAIVGSGFAWLCAALLPLKWPDHYNLLGLSNGFAAVMAVYAGLAALHLPAICACH